MSETGIQSEMHSGGEVVLTGVVVCPGLGIGNAHRVDTDIEVARREITADEVGAEQERYGKAVRAAQEHVQDHIRAIHQDTPEHAAVVFEAHRAILRDEEFHTRVRTHIAQEHRNAEWALQEEGARLMSEFEELRDSFFRSRMEDVRDMVTTVLEILAREGTPETPPLKPDRTQVLATPHLHPSSAMHAQRVHAAGFATESRVVSSHAAILLKGFGMPTVGSVEGLMREVHEDDTVVVDAINGQVIVRPSEETLKQYQTLEAGVSILDQQKEAEPCTTVDGTPVMLTANIGNPDHVRFVFQRGLEGVGLFRTEFLVMQEGRVPEEDEQVEMYRRVIRDLADRHVVIRTFDLGADKTVRGLNVCTGQNPALGVRGIRRHLLRNSAELRRQLRAILRAATSGHVGILIPMVTTVRDVREVKAHLDAVRDELQREGIPFGQHVTLGAMIETPASAIAVRAILEEVDFISLGTNDLLQYFTAADRDNEDVVAYNDAENSAFLWLLKYIIDAAAEAGRIQDVTICGEIASRPDLIPTLLRLGYRSFSIMPVMADTIRNAIRGTDLSQHE